LRSFARFEAVDHFQEPVDGPDTLRRRVEHVLAEHDVYLPGGRITALLQARVLGYVFNPLSLFWCHDAAGEVRAVIAEVHNTYGDRHAYLLPPDQGEPAVVPKELYVSPFQGSDGHYLVRAPRPDGHVDITISLFRDDQQAFVATLRGSRRSASAAQVARLQLTAPLAPLMGAFAIRAHAAALMLRGVPTVPRGIPAHSAAGAEGVHGP
jgi:uncharacterized protein